MKTITIVAGVVGLCSIILWLIISKTEFPEKKLFDFNRQVLDLVENGNVTDLQYNSYYIAGINGDKIYLANTEAPFSLLEYSHDLKEHRTIRLRTSGKDSFYKRSIRITTFDSTVFLSEGETPRIYRGLLQHSEDECELKRLIYDDIYFFNATPCSSQSLLLQSVSNAPYKNILCKASDTDSSHLVSKTILKEQVDGLFCTSGTLRYDRQLRLAVYVYTHRNEYILLDTNLHVSGRGHTIDTFSVARVKAMKTGSNNDWQLVSPGSQVNRYAVVSESRLYVVSGLYTRSDIMVRAIHSSIIDIYDLNKQAYCGSFYLPDHDGEKFTSMLIAGNSLYAVYGHYLKSFRLNRLPTDTDTI